MPVYVYLYNAVSSCIILSEQLQCFLQSPTLDYLISADQPRSSQEIEAVTLGFLSSELISIKRLVYHSHFPHQWIGRGVITTSCWQLDYYHWYIRTPLPQRFPSCTAYLKSMNIFIKISFTTSVSNILTIAMFISLKVFFIKDDRGFPSYTIPI